MKKILLGTTALLTVGLVSGVASAADPITLGLSGYYRAALFGVLNEKNGAGNQESVTMRTDAEIHVDGSTTLDNGIGVSVHVEFEVSGNDGAADRHVDEHYMDLTGGFGKIRLGYEDTIGNSYSQSAPSGAGLIASNDPVMNPSGLRVPSTTVNLGGDSASVRFETPNMNGFQLGVSYSPDADARDENRQPKTGQGEIYGVGAAYSTTFDDIALKLGASYAYMDNETSGRYCVDGAGRLQTALGITCAAGQTQASAEDSWQWQGGMTVTAMGFSIGGSVMLEDSNRASKGSNLIYDAGINYKTGPVTVGLSASRGTYETVPFESTTPGSALAAAPTAAAALAAAAAGVAPAVTAAGFVGMDYQYYTRKETRTALRLGATYDMGAGVNMQAVVGWDQNTAPTIEAAASADRIGRLAGFRRSAWSTGVALGLSF